MPQCQLSGLGAHLISSNRLVSIGSPLGLAPQQGHSSPGYIWERGKGGNIQRFSYLPAFLALFIFIYPPSLPFMPCLSLALSPTQCIFATCINSVLGKPLPCESKLKQKPCNRGFSSVFLFRREIIQINQAVFVYGQITKCIRNF